MKRIMFWTLVIAAQAAVILYLGIIRGGGLRRYYAMKAEIVQLQESIAGIDREVRSLKQACAQWHETGYDQEACARCDLNYGKGGETVYRYHNG
jgi:cell division protein FtsB